MTSAAKAAATQRLAVTGMTCAGCVNAVTRVLARVPGTAAIQVTLETGRADVAGSATPDALLAAVRNAGYGAELLPW
jgi:P-type Cu+ transporter